MAADHDMSPVLVLLDLSTAFDTIDHDIHLNRLRYQVGISGTALHWLSSCLLDRRFYVTVNHLCVIIRGQDIIWHGVHLVLPLL